MLKPIDVLTAIELELYYAGHCVEPKTFKRIEAILRCAGTIRPPSERFIPPNRKPTDGMRYTPPDSHAIADAVDCGERNIVADQQRRRGEAETGYDRKLLDRDPMPVYVPGAAGLEDM